MQKIFLTAAAIFGLTSVLLGAFGAHALKPFLNEYQLSIWEKGIHYQIAHALALFLCSLYLKNGYAKFIRNAGIFFIIGILCFSGSLYLLASQNLTALSVSFIGPITPLGGLFFIAGWLFIFLEGIRKEK